MFGIDDDAPVTVFNVRSMTGIPYERIPIEVLWYLLAANHETNVGSWECYEDDDKDMVFAQAYTALRQGITAEEVGWICAKLVKQAQEFDKKMKAAGLLR